MGYTEQALTIDVGDNGLIAILHAPEQPSDTAVLMVAAGDLQYRAGCGRQLVLFAREFAQQGYPVLRFDHRGLGDSEGDLLGFEHIQEDIRAAIDCIREHQPGVQHIVMWGGCDAASGIMMHSWSLDHIDGWILSNPFIANEEMHAKTARLHYLKRLQEREFWVKLFTGRYNVFHYAAELSRQLFAKVRSLLRKAQSSTSGAGATVSVSFPERMLEGTLKFNGRALFVMSGRSMTREQFDLAVKSSRGWQAALDSLAMERVDVDHADQTFSTPEAQAEFVAASLSWLKGHAAR